MTGTCKLTTQRQISQLLPAVLRIVLFSVLYLYFVGFNSYAVGWYIMAVFFLIDILPALLLHFQYLVYSRHQIISIDSVTGTLKVQSISESVYSFNDILELEYHASYGGGSGWYSFGEYRYYKIFLNDSKVIYITSLMMENIKENLEPLLKREAVKRYHFLAFIK